MFPNSRQNFHETRDNKKKEISSVFVQNGIGCDCLGKGERAWVEVA